MKQEDKLFTFFRKNQHKLNEMPSPQAWQKLERRLNGKRRSKVTPIYRLFMMMAATIALLFLIIVLVEVAKKESTQQVVQIQELEQTSSKMIQQAILEAQFRAKYQEKLSKSIKEGSAKRLLVTSRGERPFLIPKKES